MILHSPASAQFAEAVADDLGQLSHELVVCFESVALDAGGGAVVRDADQEVTTLGVEERGDGLAHSMGNGLVVLPVLLEIPAQRGFELHGL